MNKFLLFPILLFALVAQAQLMEIPRNCQTGTFNITEAATINGGSLYSYVFFETLANAENNVSPLTGDLTNYIPAEGQDVIYAIEMSPFFEFGTVKTIPFVENFTSLILVTTDDPSSGASVHTFSGKPPFTYQWFIDETPVPGETSSGINLAAYNYPDYFTCVVTDANGCASIPGGYNSQSSTFTRNDYLEIIAMPEQELTTERSVLANDVYENYPVPAVTTQSFQALPIGDGWDNFSLATNGKISTTESTPLGNYLLQYQMVLAPSMTVLGTSTVNLRVAKAALKLTAFFDINNDGIKQNEEPFINQGVFSNLPQTPQFYAPVKYNKSTIYSITANANPVSIKIEGNNSATNFPFAVCNTYYENVPLTLESPFQELYFPFVPSPTDDLRINTGVILPSPGFTRPFIITVTNPTMQAAGPFTVHFTKPQQSQITTYPNGSTPTEDGFSLIVESINAFSTLQIGGNVQFDVIPNVSLNDPVSMSATLVYAPDPDISNNTSNFNGVFLGSYDPNDILEARGPQIDVATFSETDYLTYTIRFENTGNAAAENIKIVNELPAGLDASTLRVLGASHSFQKSFINGVLTIRMDNIQLPPSNGSSTVGYGFVTYRVKPTAGFTVGTHIEDTAEIYFDFNPAIVTPVWTTTFVEQLSVDETQPLVQFYSNPVTDVFELTLANTETIIDAQVYDLLGKKVSNAKSVNGKLHIQAHTWPSGIYILKLSTPTGTLSYKLVKE